MSATTPTADADRERVFSAIAQEERALAEATAALVRIPSVNPAYPGQDYDDVVGGEADAAAYMAGVYRELGCTVDTFDVDPGRGNAVGVLEGSGGGRSLIYNGHIDVVPAGDLESWTSGDPFSGRIDDDRIWGRGSTDMKAAVVAQAFAVRAIRATGLRLRGDITLEAVAGEETGQYQLGTGACIERGYRADGAVVGEPSGPPVPLAIVPVSTGIIRMRVTIRGKATHSCLWGEAFRAGGEGPAVGVSAIDKGVLLYQAMRRLEEEWGLTKQHPLFPPGHFTICPGVVTGSPEGVLIPYFVPDVMRIEYCVWHHPDERPDEVKREIEEFIARVAQTDTWLREHPPQIEWISQTPPANLPLDHPLCTELVAAHETAVRGTPFEGPATILGFRAAEETTRFLDAGIPAISYGPGDLRVAHAPDEYVSRDELVAACRTFATFAMDWCGYERAS